MPRIDKTLRGLAFLPEDLAASSITADSVYSENSPRPGSPTAHEGTTRGRLIPQVLATQSRPVSFVGARAGGYPELGGLGAGVGYYFPSEGEALTDLRHWRPAILITDARNFGTGHQSDYAIAASSPRTGYVVVAFPTDSSATATYAYNPHTNTWTTNGNGPSARGALAFTPGSERLLWVDERGESYVSDDYGATWSAWGSFASFVATDGSYDYDGDIRRLVFDGFGGCAFLGKRSGVDTLDLWTSNDLGLTWALSATSMLYI